MKTIAALVATAALTAPAFAGGPTVVAEEPVIAPVETAYVAPGLDWTGAYVGAQIGYGDVDSNGAALDGNDWFGGVHAGYRWDLGNWVAGSELSYDANNIGLGAVDGDELDSVLALKLTAGREIGNSLVYGTLGAARAEASVGGVDLSDNGLVYGLGFDYAVNERWTVGGEVTEHKFDNFDASGVDFDATTVKAKVGMRF
ncbi:outer membrane protein [Rhodobacter sp. SY28-1]|uniref:outer membrane protein n=1 Tax=Rhodobacter sp. SY28-1 TaxID=2562317 RepID=UPI0010C03DB6|nr:outer membrane beta-barrel protein [Rhodobacter sp. SY28-1]